MPVGVKRCSPHYVRSRLRRSLRSKFCCRRVRARKLSTFKRRVYSRDHSGEQRSPPLDATANFVEQRATLAGRKISWTKSRQRSDKSGRILFVFFPSTAPIVGRRQFKTLFLFSRRALIEFFVFARCGGGGGSWISARARCRIGRSSRGAACLSERRALGLHATATCDDDDDDDDDC